MSADISETISEPTLDAANEQIDERLAQEWIFANHVGYVRAHGDKLDASPEYGAPSKRIRNTYYKMAGGVALAGVVMPDVVVFGAAVSVVAFTGGLLHVRSQAQRARQAAANHDSRRMPGERYELYKVRGDTAEGEEVVMHWYGPRKEETTAGTTPKSRAESLSMMADLAYKNDIKAIMISTEELHDVAAKASKYSDTIVPTEPWLKRRKDINVSLKKDKKPAMQEMYAFEPGSLLKFAHELTVSRIEDQKTPELIETLRRSIPGHPLVSQYDKSRLLDGDGSEKLQQTAAECLRRRLDNTVSELDRSDPTQPQRRRYHLEPRLDGNSVLWHHQALPKETSPLLQGLGVSQSRMDQLCNDVGELDPKELALAIEYMVYCRDPPTEEQTVHEEDTAASESTLPLLQTTLLDHRSKDVKAVESPKFRDIATIPALFAGVGAMFAPVVFFHDLPGANLKAETAYASEYNTTRDSLTTTQKIEARQPIDIDGSRLLNAYNRARQPIIVPAEAAYNFLGSQMGNALTTLGITHKPPGPAGSVAGNMDVSFIGNSPLSQEDTQPIWHVEGHGMDTAGYWAQRTSANYSRGLWGATVDQPQVFSPLTLLDKVVPAAPGGEKKDDDNAYIKVSSPANMESAGTWVVPGVGDYNMYSVPVLDGTRITGATYSGAKVAKVALRDGTYLLGILEDKQSSDATLTYTLAPDPDHHTHALRKQLQRPGFEDVEAVWNDRVPGLDPDKGLRRAEQEADYVRTHFDYSLTPLSEIDNAQLQSGTLIPAELIKASFASKKAICNTANTIVGLDNPSLNAAWGYHENGDGVLTGAESHLWLVGGAGQIVDATPPLKNDQNSGSQHSLTPLYGVGGAGLALLAARGAFVYRRRTMEKRALAKLATFDSADLQEVKQITEMAAFAESFDENKLLPVDDKLDAKIAFNRLRSPVLHSGYVRRRLDEMLTSDVSEDAAAKLVRARKVLSLIGKANLAEEVQRVTPLDSIL